MKRKGVIRMWTFERFSATFAVVIFAFLTLYEAYNWVYVEASTDYLICFACVLVMFLLHTVRMIMVFIKKENKIEVLD